MQTSRSKALRCSHVTPKTKKITAGSVPRVSLQSYKENCPNTSLLCFWTNQKLFTLSPDILTIAIILIKFHENWVINVASRVLTTYFFNLNLFLIPYDKFQNNRDIIWIKFYEGWAKNMITRMFISFFINWPSFWPHMTKFWTGLLYNMIKWFGPVYLRLGNKYGI